MDLQKTALTGHPILKLLAQRWSPYAFAEREVSTEDLRSLFEAARWAPSSYNEQPWSYIVAVRSQPSQFEGLLSCLVEGNQAWARHAPVLALGVVRETFTRNDRPNPAAAHDLGLASMSLVVEAAARNLVVHQMIGIVPDRARELYEIPEHSRALTGIAIGHLGDSSKLPDALRARDLAPRTRKSLRELVFGTRWGDPSSSI